MWVSTTLVTEFDCDPERTRFEETKLPSRPVRDVRFTLGRFFRTVGCRRL